MLSENIFSFWAEKLAVLAKKYRHGCQNCNLRNFKKFWGKTVFFLKLNMIANFIGLRDEKKGLLVKKFSSGFLQQEFAIPEKCLEEKWFVFRKSFIFLLSFLEFEWFICLCWKFFGQVWKTTNQPAETSKLWKLTLKICFFKQFWTLTRKNLDFQQNSKAWYSKP